MITFALINEDVAIGFDYPICNIDVEKRITLKKP